jgi:Skp family chaperone for outer membrane proteins
MKRIACLMLVLSIACASCQVKESSRSGIKGLGEVQKALLTRIDSLETALESQIAELRENITKLEEELSQIKIALKPDKA